MRARRRILAAPMAAAILVHGAARAGGIELQVYAASSLTDVLAEVAAAYARAGGDALVFNFAGSNVLALQIRAGAPADVFVSADAPRMQLLDRDDLLLEGTRRSLVGNGLVVVVHGERPAAIAGPEGLPAARRLALAEPSSVPAGVYARAYLERAGLWARVRARIVPTESVRAALAAVESGNVDAAIVYRTDAAASRRVRIAYVVPDSLSPPIAYEAAVLRRSRHPEAARQLLAYLASPAAQTLFAQHGFRALADSTR